MSDQNPVTPEYSDFVRYYWSIVVKAKMCILYELYKQVVLLGTWIGAKFESNSTSILITNDCNEAWI